MPHATIYPHGIDPSWLSVNGNDSTGDVGFSTGINETSGNEYVWDEAPGQQYYGI